MNSPCMQNVLRLVCIIQNWHFLTTLFCRDARLLSSQIWTNGCEWLMVLRRLLCIYFLETFMSLRGELEWPARFSDLTLCNHFLWGYLKSLVYSDHPNNLCKPKWRNFRVAIANIDADTLDKVGENYQFRISTFIDHSGVHLDISFSRTDKKKILMYLCVKGKLINYFMTF